MRGVLILTLSFFTLLLLPRPGGAPPWTASPPSWTAAPAPEPTAAAAPPPDGAAAFTAARHPTDPVGVSVPLSLAGDMGFNVRAALDANGGALRQVVIPPGAAWSFNAALGDPRRIPLRVVGGVLGGGWCDLASRYVQAARPILPPEAFAFTPHRQATGYGLADVADADAVAIWSIDGQPGSFGGRRDLQITNVRDRPLVFRVIPDGDRIIIQAALAP